MQFLILVLIFASGSFEYLEHMGWLPDNASFVQEIIAVIIAGTVVLAGARNGFHYVHPSYWIVFGALVLIILCGVVLNSVGTGPMFAGMRTYLRAIPLFFLPAVFLIRERQIRTQLVVLMILALLQLPISLDQRMTTFDSAYFSGDRTVGTLLGSPLLTIFLVCAACVLTGMYMRKRIGGWSYLIMFLAILTPTMLNETKGTIVLLPVGLLTTFIVASRPGLRMRNGFIATVVLAIFATIFIPVYDYFMKPRWGYGIVEFMTMDGRVENYLDKGAVIGSRRAGRVDALVVPVSQLAKEPSRFAFGYGIGNASDSALGSQFAGKYFRRFEPFRQTSATVVMLELGMAGLVCVLALFWLILRDAYYVARMDEGVLGALSVGWMGVTITMIIGFFYATTINSSALSYLFFYLSGLIAAQRMRLADTVPVRAPQRAWKRAHAAG